jgi:hypothetical protein
VEHAEQVVVLLVAAVVGEQVADLVNGDVDLVGASWAAMRGGRCRARMAIMPRR